MDDAQPSRHEPIRFEFTGSGSEYFRIWIVNLLLTLLTLSVYSAWAKVRREKYFHQSTRLAGASFDYHGRPLPILLGRVVAICLLALTQVAAFDATVAMVAWTLTLALLPWLMLRSAQFRLANTSYRGLRFRLAATPKQAYRTFGGYLAVALLAMALVVSGAGNDLRAASGSFFVLLFLMYPLLSASWRKFVVNHARYGDLSFTLPLRKRDVVRTYLRASGLAFGLLLLLSLVAGAAYWVLSLPGGVLAEIGATVIAVVSGLTAYAIYFAVQPLVAARLQNLCWNATSAITKPLKNLLIEHKFASDLKPSRYALRSVRNWFLVILTLGLFRPFAMIDLARRRISAISLIPDASLDTVLADLNVDGPSAVGSEAVDLLGFDISL
jgi:uncharacterized membrane protein YjgN (DUF898 family)